MKGRGTRKGQKEPEEPVRVRAVLSKADLKKQDKHVLACKRRGQSSFLRSTRRRAVIEEYEFETIWDYSQAVRIPITRS